MPHVRIEVRRGWAGALKPFLIEAVHSALVAHLKVPAGDRVARVIEHEPTDFATPPARGERFTLVTIDLFSGRSDAAKRGLYRGVVDNLERLGIPRDDVNILLHESPRVNWGVRGGEPASEIELGFTVEV